MIRQFGSGLRSAFVFSSRTLPSARTTAMSSQQSSGRSPTGGGGGSFTLKTGVLRWHTEMSPTLLFLFLRHRRSFAWPREHVGCIVLSQHASGRACTREVLLTTPSRSPRSPIDKSMAAGFTLRFGTHDGDEMNCGDGVSHTCSSFENRSQPYNSLLLNLAGLALTKYLMEIHREQVWDTLRVSVSSVDLHASYQKLKPPRHFSSATSMGRPAPGSPLGLPGVSGQ